MVIRGKDWLREDTKMIPFNLFLEPITLTWLSGFYVSCCCLKATLLCMGSTSVSTLFKIPPGTENAEWGWSLDIATVFIRLVISIMLSCHASARKCWKRRWLKYPVISQKCVSCKIWNGFVLFRRHQKMIQCHKKQFNQVFPRFIIYKQLRLQ